VDDVGNLNKRLIAEKLADVAAQARCVKGGNLDALVAGFGRVELNIELDAFELDGAVVGHGALLCFRLAPC